jgi:nicotinate phosphoribosyltransferase
LDEYRLAELVHAGAPIDAFGVGTQLATSADAPALSAVYKLVELKHDDTVMYTAKFSADKSTLPGAKQVYRYPDHDLIALGTECGGLKGEPLVRPVLIDGKPLEALPGASKIRARSQAVVAALPKELLSLDEVPPYQVEVSPRLTALARQVRERLEFIEAR